MNTLINFVLSTVAVLGFPAVIVWMFVQATDTPGERSALPPAYPHLPLSVRLWSRVRPAASSTIIDAPTCMRTRCPTILRRSMI